MGYLEEEQEAEAERQKYRQSKPNGAAPWIDLDVLSGAHWLNRDIPEPDFILGELVSTTSRIEVIGPTGIGKSNFLLALAFAAADGRDFLHWRGHGTPRRILFLDGEMSRRLAKKRIVDATSRHGGMPATLHYFNREDFPDLAPLDTVAGQEFIDRIINELGGVDLVILDNIDALLTTGADDYGMQSWQRVLPWIRDLTRRAIGQVWVHHTGQDESHGYGSKTREWQLDTVALMERTDTPQTDIVFKLSFTKARERSPDNRADFEPAGIALADDQWSSERGGKVGTRRTATDRAFELLNDAIAREGIIPPANEHIPPNTLCVTEGLWRRYCKAGCLTDSDADPLKKAEADKKAFQRAARKLIGHKVGKWDLWVWIIR